MMGALTGMWDIWLGGLVRSQNGPVTTVQSAQAVQECVCVGGGGARSCIHVSWGACRAAMAQITTISLSCVLLLLPLLLLLSPTGAVAVP
jgi:hypothetical protein